MLKLENIKKAYTNTERQILDSLSFEVKKGDSIAILGPSGSGKSTLLNVMSTLDTPDSGEVLFEGNSLATLSNDEKADFRNQKMGFVFQQHHLLPQLTLLENVLVPTLPEKNKETKKALKERALLLINKVGLSQHLHKRPGQMSVGECQRTAVVRALINSPQVLFADEPTGSLDHESAQRLVELLVHLNKSDGLALVLVTHDQEIATKLDQVYHLIGGLLKRV